MNVSKVYLVWALGVGGVALVVGVWVSAELLLTLMGLVAMPSWLWLLARCLAVAQVVCLLGVSVLMAMGLSGGFRGWVVSGVRRCGQWIRGLF